jgi:hypothetical protein
VVQTLLDTEGSEQELSEWEDLAGLVSTAGVQNGGDGADYLVLEFSLVLSVGNRNIVQAYVKRL